MPLVLGHAQRGPLLARAILMAALLTANCFAFDYGKPDENPERSASAREMLTRLWSAAKERADAVRNSQRTAQGKGETYTPSNQEMFGSLLDYAKDKISNPPLLSVEKNLIQIQQNTLALARELVQTRELLQALLRAQAQPVLPMDQTGLQRVLDSRLVPVQGPRYSIIPSPPLENQTSYP